jgi:hypothetical protein
MRRTPTLAAAALAALALAAGPARADGESIEAGAGERAAPVTNRINLRVGAATTDRNGRPTICLDVRIFAGFGVESCGTGQAVLHDDPGREMAHFRGTWTLLTRHTDHGTGKLRAGAGFAELQVGADHPGFRFGSPDPADRGSISGPEAAVSGQWLIPLAGGVEAVAPSPPAPPCSRPPTSSPHRRARSSRSSRSSSASAGSECASLGGCPEKDVGLHRSATPTGGAMAHHSTPSAQRNPSERERPSFIFATRLRITHGCTVG